MSSEKTFFSYSRDDSEFVLKLAKDLRAAGANIWLDQLDIPAGKRWDSEIEQALENAKGQLVILTPSSVDSHNVMDEVSYALEKGKHVIPILFKECQIPFRLKRLQYIDFTGNYDTGFNQLLKALDLETSKKEKAPEVSSIAEQKITPDKQNPIVTGEKRSEELNKVKATSSPPGKIRTDEDSVKKKSPVKVVAAVVAVAVVAVFAVVIITNMGPDDEETEPIEIETVTGMESGDDPPGGESNLNDGISENDYAALVNPDAIVVCAGIDEYRNPVSIQDYFNTGEVVFVVVSIRAPRAEEVIKFEWLDNFGLEASYATEYIIERNLDGHTIYDERAFDKAGVYEVVLYNSTGYEIGSKVFTVEEAIGEY